MYKSLEIARNLWETKKAEASAVILEVADAMLLYPDLCGWYQWGLCGDGFFDCWDQLDTEFYDIVVAEMPGELDTFTDSVIMEVLGQDEKYAPVLAEMKKVRETY